jgi:organic hydroperoxide reductase OsmC/OhrA
MLSYPISFFGSSKATPGMETNWKTDASGNEISCAVPKEFDGSGIGMSPEDLYLLALQNCFLATFKVYAHYSKLTFKSVEVKSELVVDLDEAKKPCMRKILMRIDLTEASDLKKAQLLVKKALDNGFILQSVKTEIIPEIHYL